MSHTPGPWTVTFVFPTNGPEFAIRADGKEAMVCGCGAYEHNLASAYYTDAEMRSNARLIAAAPDLLDALRAFCGDYESTSERIPEIQAAYLHALEVIAKAEATT